MDADDLLNPSDYLTELIRLVLEIHLIFCYVCHCISFDTIVEYTITDLLGGLLPYLDHLGSFLLKSLKTLVFITLKPSVKKALVQKPLD